MHPASDRDGRRLSIKEALRGELAIQGQHATKASHNLSAEEMIAELDKIFMPRQESSLARQEFHDYKQHPDEPALAYFANKLILFDKGWPGETNREFLLVTAQEDLCSRPVKRNLLEEAHTFNMYEHLKDRTMTLIAAQRKAIKDGLAYDTSMDGPKCFTFIDTKIGS